MNVIDVTDLQKRYGDRLVVDGVSFTVEEGEIFGILGPERRRQDDDRRVHRRSPDAGRRHDPRPRVRPPGRPGSPADPRGRAAPGERAPRADDRHARRSTCSRRSTPHPADPTRLLDDLDLADHRDTAYRNLSGGQKQRLSIALALVGRPRVAILDELSTGLDPNARRETWRVIESMRDQGVTVLLVTHLMEEAERLADRVAVFRDGRVVAIDTPAGIVARADPEQRVRFRPSVELDDGLLAGLPEVRRIERSGPTVVVTGRGDLLAAVTAVLARNGIVARDLRIDQATLDDAFIALTGRSAATTSKETCHERDARAHPQPRRSCCSASPSRGWRRSPSPRRSS